MKKLVVFFILIVVLQLSAVEQIELAGSFDGIRLISNSSDNLQINCSISSLTNIPVNAQRGNFNELRAATFTYKQEPGLPKLIEQGKLIAVPLGAEVEIVINDSRVTEYDLTDWEITNPLMPVQPPLAKSADPSKQEFVWNEAAYNIDKWYGEEILRAEEIGILRGQRIFRLVYAPLAYNPVRNKIRLRNEVDAVVNFVGSDLAATSELREKTWSPVFENVYSKMLLNYARLETREDLTRYPIKYVIISDDMFEAQLQPFIEWKTQQGYEVIEVYTDEIGNSTTAIANYIEGLWEEATPDDPAPSFILFVGDTAQIPAYNGSQGSHVTDLNYVRLEGGDFMPEIYYGRFSARTTAELQPQIDKTLEFEMYNMPDPSYLEEVVMIAGMDSYHGSQWGNGQINYGTNNYFNAAHGITSHTYLYPNSGSNSGQIVQNVSNGVGYINYTAHGSSTSWSDPSFTISNINNLQNEHKYPLAVGNCCLTNKFEVGECFGEAWLREEDGGAIGYIGGTNSTYWDEDFWWGVGSGNISSNPTYTGTGAGAYDGMFHDHGETFENWFTAQAAFIMAGNLAVVEGGGSYNYYWEIYALMGDPSLNPYFGVPAVNEVTHGGQIFIGSSQFTINAEPYSYVGLSMDGELLAGGLVDESGSITLDFESVTNAGMLDLVVTAQNFEPYFAEIQSVPNEGAFLSIEDYTISSNNGDGVIDFGETIEMDIEVENVGIEAATNVTAELSINDPYITVTNNTVEAAFINVGEFYEFSGFEFEVAEIVPDEHSFQAEISFIYDEGDNEASLSLTAYAPILGLGNTYVTNDDNNNGRLDPGETAELELEITNTGSSTVESVLCMVSTASEYITVSNTWSFIPQIVPGDAGTYPFMVEVAENCPVGETITFTAEVTAETSLSYNGSFSLNVGLNLEDFESGDLTEWEWETSGDADWFVTSSAPYEGTYCVESGDIGNNDISVLSIELDVLYDDGITFNRKVSSESGWDFLIFEIDGEEIDSWSGSQGWAEVSYPVSAGTHTFSWIYDKDGSVSSGSDCGWIDYIIFPPIGVPQPPEMTCSLEQINQIIELNSILSEDFSITNTGGGTLYYYLSVAETDRSIEGSTFTIDADTYIPGEEVTWNLEVYNNSGDAEWLTDIAVEFPTGVTVITATDFTGGSGELVYNGETGNGVVVEWNDPNGGWGQIHGGETANASITVMIDANQSGDLELDWTLTGDNYGSTPHEISGTITLTTEILPLEWAELSQYSGVLNGGESDDIVITFDSSELEIGIYTAHLIINDNRETTIIPITLTVGGEIEYGDVDDNGNVEALDASLVLQYTVGIDPDPYAPLPWEGWQILRADVDGNAMVEAFDASLILQYFVGLISEFPAERTRSEGIPEAEITYSLNSDKIYLQNSGELYSFYLISDKAGFSELLSTNEDIALSQNNGEVNKVALASAENISGEFLSLNYHYIEGEDIHLRYFANGISSYMNISAEELAAVQVPAATSLGGNYPNPFNPSTEISYQLKEDANVKIEVFNLKGQKTATLVNEIKTAGYHSVNWQADNTASGVYFYRLQAGSYSETRRMLLLK